MKLTIVIPCYNEHGTIRAIVDAVRAEGAVPGIPFMPTDRAKQLIEHYNLH